MLAISPGKIAHVIVRAREIGVKVSRWDTPGDTADADTILENRPGDATEAELRSFIRNLNDDEKSSLVAVMWIGRGSFLAEDLAEALQTAREEATTPTEDYLLGVPHLAENLEYGMELLGMDPADAEGDLV